MYLQDHQQRIKLAGNPHPFQPSGDEFDEICERRLGDKYVVDVSQGQGAQETRRWGIKNL